MKVFYIGLVFAALALNMTQANLKDEIQALSKVCTAETKSKPEEVSKFFSNGMLEKDATDTIKCHIKCMMEKNGHFVNGVLDQEHAMKLFDVPALKDIQDDIAKQIAKCSQEKGANDCDTAAKIGICFNDSDVGKKALSGY